ncbi:hypothetical protein GCM10011576_25180 [Micromonospora parathelypteridis]|nr:hypothetical protein GCM10011576_25180 [Micromonospora parathelypteridis]
MINASEATEIAVAPRIAACTGVGTSEYPARTFKASVIANAAAVAAVAHERLRVLF